MTGIGFFICCILIALANIADKEVFKSLDFIQVFFLVIGFNFFTFFLIGEIFALDGIIQVFPIITAPLILSVEHSVLTLRSLIPKMFEKSFAEI
jgi:hypothetical protein